MQLNTKQTRIFKLAGILGTGKPVPATQIIDLLACSEPTLTRALKELRESYSAEIKYSKSAHAYQLVMRGLLDKKTLKRMSEELTLSSNAGVKTETLGHKVTLDKNKKTSVSLSLRMTMVRKLDRLARLTGTSRSESVELLAEQYIDEFIAKIQRQK